MKYLCLVYAEEKKLEDMPDSECLAYDAALREGGHCLASEALQPVETATTVRVRNGKVSVIDGPFAETKEQLAGFYLVESRDLNEAIRLAAGIPPCGWAASRCGRSGPSAKCRAPEGRRASGRTRCRGPKCDLRTAGP